MPDLLWTLIGIDRAVVIGPPVPDANSQSPAKAAIPAHPRSPPLGRSHQGRRAARRGNHH